MTHFKRQMLHQITTCFFQTPVSCSHINKASAAALLDLHVTATKLAQSTKRKHKRCINDQSILACSSSV